MKPPVDTLYITQLGREQLVKLKRQTGIEHYNVICRWAFCASLSESSVPVRDGGGSTGGIAIDWRVFAGEFSDVFSALLLFRARTDAADADSESVAHCLRSHVHRG